MLNVSDALKQIYRRNMFPMTTVNADIQGKISFGDLGLTIGNDRIVKDTFRLTEMISDTGDLDFGSTNASVVEFTVADVPEDLNGQRFTITQTVNGTYTVPLGTFTVDSCKRQDDLRFKDIVAYDDMQKFNKNVAEWYNGLTFPITVKGMRESLCQYCGVAYETVTLVNDSVKVYKTLDTNELNGKEVLRAIAEVNGTFAHINRYAKLTFIGLDSFALYPSETLYPADDLYPVDVTEIVEKQGENAIAYISSKYEDYTVSAIDGVIVRDDENADGGVTVGETTNPYVMSGNMLIIGKTTEELTTIANNLLSKIGKVVYTPHDTESIGLPYVEVGDTVLNANSADKELFVAKRVLTGVSSVMDNFSVGGNPKRENNDTVDSVEIRKLKGKTMKIFKDIDRIGVEIENFETSTNTQFEVADGRITAEISRAQSAESSLQVSINGVKTSVSDLATSTETRFTQTNSSITAEAKRASEAEASLQLSIDGVSSSVTNLSESTSTRFQQTAESISAEVTRAQEAEASLQLSVNGLRTEVSGKIDGEEARSIFAVEIGKITLSADQINLNGYFTANGNFSIDNYGNMQIIGDGYKIDVKSYGMYIGNQNTPDLATYIKAGTIAFADETNKTIAEFAGIYHDKTIKIGQRNHDSLKFEVYGDDGYFNNIDSVNGAFKTLETITLNCAAVNGGTPITTANVADYVPTNTNQLTGDFRTGANGTYVALANSSGNKYLATTEWVMNYVTSKLG